jgi:hypothetical protein
MLRIKAARGHDGSLPQASAGSKRHHAGETWAPWIGSNFT